MDVYQAADLGREVMLQTLWLAAPLVGGVLVVGLIVGLMQAATQVQEATVSFVPKVIVLALLLIWLGPWTLEQLVEFTRTFINEIPRRM